MESSDTEVIERKVTELKNGDVLFVKVKSGLPPEAVKRIQDGLADSFGHMTGVRIVVVNETIEDMKIFRSI